MLKLIKTDLSLEIQKRIFRMMLDSRMMATMSDPELRAVYSELEATRDRLSGLLDRVDGKHV